MQRVLRSFLTDRLSGVPLGPAHRDLFVGMYTNPDVMRFIGPPLTVTAAVSAFEASVAAAQADPVRQAYWAVSERSSERPVAVAGLSLNSDRGEIGCIIGVADQGQGFGTEIVGEVGAQAFAHFGVSAVTTHASRNNRATFVFLPRLGYTSVATSDLNHAGEQVFEWTLTREMWCKWRAGRDE